MAIGHTQENFFYRWYLVQPVSLFISSHNCTLAWKGEKHRAPTPESEPDSISPFTGQSQWCSHCEDCTPHPGSGRNNSQGSQTWFRPSTCMLTICQGGHWTLDNAEMNTTFMKEFEELMHARDIPFNHKDNCIMCFPHITNICTTHVIESFTNSALTVDEVEFNAAFPPQVLAEQTNDEACARDPIALCRCTVHASRASGKRWDHFHEIIHNGNAKGWFKLPENPDKTIQLPDMQLLHDIRTCWDSVYQMICCFRELWLVCNP